MKPGSPPTLRQRLAYEPVELEFGTSGLRGLVKDITDLEAYAAVRGFLDFLRGPRGPVCLAGDLRPSTERILSAACRAVMDAGFTPINFGRIPTPALLFSAMKRKAPAVMVTGSHIPFERNGMKFTRPDGEVLKQDEKPIKAAMRAVREKEYSTPFDSSMFDDHGALRSGFRVPLPPESDEAAAEYVRRYTAAFPPDCLGGKRILVYQHSSVSRDILVRILGDLGARVIPAGRSDTFVAVDTEAVNEEMIAAIQGLVDVNGGDSILAVVSTDGDGDRPLVLGVDAGKVRFYPGDILGIVTADFLGAREIAVPVSVNDAVDIHCASWGVRAVKTRIGSPYVIAAMREVGWEANGGFLTAVPVQVPDGGTLEALPTRDALLPILAALMAGPGSCSSLKDVFSRLPSRYGTAALVRSVERERAQRIMRAISPHDASIMEARLQQAEPVSWRVLHVDGSESSPDGTDGLSLQMSSIRDTLQRCFTPENGFGPVQWINWMDGVRVGFANGDIAHVRASGNAPEMRVYAYAGSQERADEIARQGAAPGGILARLEEQANAHEAIQGFCMHSQAVSIEGAVQNYAWGGYTFIPSLLGKENPGQVPHAELWLGAHPLAPASAVLTPYHVGLDRLLQEAAPAVLGEKDAARFRGRLPFLLKVLNARTMLSIQAHPSREQAAAGFARENAAGIPLNAPGRTYRDDNHKPEVHVSLSEFWMLHGFRPLEEIARVLEDNPGLARIMPEFGQRLATAAGTRDGRQELLRSLYTKIMIMPRQEIDAILNPLIARLEKSGQADSLPREEPGYWALQAARQMPLPSGGRDRGIISIYLMNLLHLRPGQGTYQPAGTLHAYLEGTTVELMANSDNVLRGGLTPKSVDTAELLRILTFTDGHPEVLEGRITGDGVRTYDTPAEEFVLQRIELEKGRPVRAGSSHSVECLVGIEGSVELASEGRSISVGRGAAALVPAGLPYALESRSSRALVFRAGIPAQRG